MFVCSVLVESQLRKRAGSGSLWFTASASRGSKCISSRRIHIYHAIPQQSIHTRAVHTISYSMSIIRCKRMHQQIHQQVHQQVYECKRQLEPRIRWMGRDKDATQPSWESEKLPCKTNLVQIPGKGYPKPMERNICRCFTFMSTTSSKHVWMH